KPVTTAYLYDRRDRRVAVLEDATQILPGFWDATRITLRRYDAAGQVVETISGLTTRPGQVDPRPRHTVSRYEPLGRVPATYDRVGSILAPRSETQYDENGNVTLMTTGFADLALVPDYDHPSATFSQYDERDRLEAMIAGYQTESATLSTFLYDKVGNRLSR